MTAQRKTTKKPASSAAAAKKPAASSAAETVVNLNSKAMQDIQSSINSEAQKAQEKIAEMGRESAEKLSQSANAASQAAGEVMAICRDNVEACVESGNIAASIAKDVSEEVAEYASQAMNDAIAFNKELFACRTLNDVVEFQNKAIKNTFEGYFEQCSRLANNAFEACNEIAEPINQRVAETTDKVSKLMSQK